MICEKTTTDDEIEIKRQTIIVNSFNEDMTLKRIRLVIIFGAVFFALVLHVGIYIGNARLLTAVSCIYIIITLIEKRWYGYGVIVYKRIIRMLLTDKDALEKYRKLVKDKTIVK